ncbi:MAG TPA: alpha/beta hydrolase, partial [Phenylobacterium sp.]
KTWTPAMLADYVEDGFRERPDGQVELACTPAWEASNFASHNHDTWGALRSLTRPTRIFRAETGSTAASLTPALDELTAAGMRIETVPDTSHFLPMERPDLVQAALLEAAG